MFSSELESDAALAEAVDALAEAADALAEPVLPEAAALAEDAPPGEEQPASIVPPTATAPTMPPSLKTSRLVYMLFADLLMKAPSPSFL